MGLALIVGFWTRMAATVAFLMVLNFHFATSAFWSVDYFRATAPGSRCSAACWRSRSAGSRLPFSVSR